MAPEPKTMPVRSAASDSLADQSRVLLQEALVLHGSGMLKEAGSICARLLDGEPDHFDALQLLGVISSQTGNHRMAVSLLGKAIALCPGSDTAYYNRGIALKELHRLDAAVVDYNRAIALKADFPQAYANRGIALREFGRLDAAIASYTLALALKPDYADAHASRGVALSEGNQPELALVSCAHAIAIRPDFAKAYSACGAALYALRRFDDSVGNSCRAIVLRPDYADGYSNLGVSLCGAMQLGAAITSYDRTMVIKPDQAHASWNKSLILLLCGDFARGWELFERRWDAKTTGEQERHFAQPLWLGKESIEGKTILLHAEQGFGDTLQFCRYAKAVTALGARVILEVPAPLLGLLGTLEGVSSLVVTGSPPPIFDCHCPLLSLPLAFKTDLGNIPASPAYLSSDPAKVAIWTERLGTRARPRIGLVWRGREAHKNDRNRSFALSALLPYLPEGFDYVSLQKEMRADDRAALEARGRIRHFGEDIRDFSDTAALCSLMDLVISVDTSVAHLSGALGRRTWILLPYVPDWRWLLDQEDSPWYPSVKLYRQGADRNWAKVFQKVGADLSTESTLRLAESDCPQLLAGEVRGPC